MWRSARPAPRATRAIHGARSFGTPRTTPSRRRAIPSTGGGNPRTPESSPGQFYSALLLAAERCACGGERLALCLPHRRELKIEALERVDDHLGNHDARKPLVVGGNDEPRRVSRARCRQRVLVRLHVVVPALPLVQV